MPSDSPFQTQAALRACPRQPSLRHARASLRCGMPAPAVFPFETQEPV